MSLLSSVFGEKPKVPTWTPIDYGDVQKGAIQQNINATPFASQLATQTNTLNQAELDRLLGGVIPDIKGIEQNVSTNLKNWSAGILGPDQQAAVERSGIAKSLGRFGGGMAGEFVGRDIGLTSYQMAKEAMGSAERWIQTARQGLMPGVMSVESMFVTTQQRLAQTTEERDKQFEHDWLKSQISAMPNPVAHGVWQAIDSYIHSYGGANSYAQTQYPGMNGSHAPGDTSIGPAMRDTNYATNTGGWGMTDYGGTSYPDWAQFPGEG